MNTPQLAPQPAPQSLHWSTVTVTLIVSVAAIAVFAWVASQALAGPVVAQPTTFLPS